MNFKHPRELGLGAIQSSGRPQVRSRPLQTKLANGLAHFCSYYEHGSCWWGLADAPAPAGTEFRWDGRRIAGLLIWVGDTRQCPGVTYTERRQEATWFLEDYTAECNGENEDEDEPVPEEVL